MKQLLITIAALVLVGCGESQQTAPAPEAKPVEPVAVDTKPKPVTVKVPEISILDAAKGGNTALVKQHLDAGADVNVKGKDGWTPLGVAAWHDYKEIVELLLAKGADVNTMNLDGKTTLDLAIGRKHTETADLLRKHGAKTAEELKAEGK